MFRSGGVPGFVVRRVLLGLIVLVMVSLVVFAATQALPGDPARAILGRSATPQSLAALRARLHLDRPVIEQYLTWISGLLHGNLGTSLAAQEPVSTLLAPKLVNSAAVVSIPLSVAIGSWAALKREKVFDTLSSNLLLVLAALPEFVVAVVLVILLATTVFPNVLPSISIIPPGSRPWDNPKALVLPALTLVIAVAPYVARIMRASMVEVLESDYVEMARLKGLPERTVLVRHALPNALGPVFQVIALNLAYLAGGIVVVEYVFAYTGIGSALQDSVVNHDLPVVQALAMLIAAVYVALNLLADADRVDPGRRAGAAGDRRAVRRPVRPERPGPRPGAQLASERGRRARDGLSRPGRAEQALVRRPEHPGDGPHRDRRRADRRRGDRAGGGLRAERPRRRPHAHHGRDPGVPADHARAGGRRRDRAARLGDCGRDRAHDRAADREGGPRCRAARRRA